MRYTTQVQYAGKLYRTVPTNGDNYSHQQSQGAWMKPAYAEFGHNQGIREKEHSDLLILNNPNHDLPEIVEKFQDVFADHKGVQNTDTQESDFLIECINQSGIYFTEQEKRLVHTTLTHLDPKGTYRKTMEEINYQRDALNGMSPEVHKYFNRGIGLSVCILARYIGRFMNNQTTTLVLPDLDSVGESITIDRKDLIQEHIFYRSNAKKIDTLVDIGEKYIETHGDFVDPNAVEGMKELDITLTGKTVEKLKSDRAEVKDCLKIS